MIWRPGPVFVFCCCCCCFVFYLLFSPASLTPRWISKENINSKYSLKISDTWRKQVHVPWTYTDPWPRRPTIIVQELCESRGGRPGLSVLTSLLVSVDEKLYWTMLRHWSQLVPNMSTDIWGHWTTLTTNDLQRTTRAETSPVQCVTWKNSDSRSWTPWLINRDSWSIGLKTEPVFELL